MVLEVLREDKTLNEIANENNTNPKNLQNWKKLFLENVEVAMELAKTVKEYKEEMAFSLQLLQHDSVYINCKGTATSKDRCSLKISL